MKYYIFLLTSLLFLSHGILAQNEDTSQSQQSEQPPKGLAKSLGLYVFPSNGQEQATQEADEYACYKWAIEQSGVDPLNPPKVEVKQVEKGPDGSAVRGAARTAAAGAAIGAITGDAGEGAAVGAIVGALRGNRSRKIRQASAQQQANQQAAAQQKALMDNFKKAFTACLEGKGYTVK
ncbi:MAG: hypothetical protein GXO47_01550 [Chlorobi bacterium]|nr:hypothetical protein [Chlorobiota bacterium]